MTALKKQSDGGNEAPGEGDLPKDEKVDAPIFVASEQSEHEVRHVEDDRAGHVESQSPFRELLIAIGSAAIGIATGVMILEIHDLLRDLGAYDWLFEFLSRLF
jgi:hypothetical protein